MARIPADVAMDINNYNDIRERLTSPSKVSSRSALVTSNTSSIPYHKKIEMNNNLPDKELGDLFNRFQLLYKDGNGEGNSVRKAADNGSTRNLQCV